MKKTKTSRRQFFKKLVPVPEGRGTGDLLFDKYSRKSGGRRLYDTGLTRFTNGESEAATNRVGNVTSGLASYTGSWSKLEVLHLLRRTGYGFTKANVDTLINTTMSAAVDTVLAINTAPPAPPVVYYSANTTTLAFTDENNLAYGADWTKDVFTTGSVGQSSNSYRQTGLRAWLCAQMLNQDITIREKMVWFWYHFIPIDFEQIFQSSNSYVNTNSARINYNYFKLFRDNATGNFKTLIKQMAMQPSMMFYLNNQANSATAPDENFARELMELFTLGKDPLSQYTQDDVVAAAKVLTGWRVQGLNSASTATNFVSASHASGTKQFSSFFNGTKIPASTAGAGEFNELIDMIFSKTQVVSEYICRRLYRYFVYYDIDSNIEAGIITPLAQTFVANNWEILPVLQQLFKSQHFYDMANRGVFIKSPFDLVIGTLRAFKVPFTVSDATNYQAQQYVWNYINSSICGVQEQQAGSIPNVAGWPAYYQQPSFHEYWINSNTVQKRFAFLQTLFTATNGYSLTYNGLNTKLKADTLAFVVQFGNTICADPNLLVAEVIAYLLPIDLSAAQKASIKQQTLLYQQTTDKYWSDAWGNYVLTPTNATYLSTVSDRVKSLVYTIIQLAEYQLM